MDITAVSSGAQNPNANSTGSSNRGSIDIAALRPTQTSTAPSDVPQVTAVESSGLSAGDQRRFENVERGAQAIAADLFAVSDTTFTIFRDASGEFITRFTSLRDGSVTFFPEPDVVAFLEQRTAERQAALDIDA